MRIAHCTDIHWQRPPGLADLLAFKRILGSANLYLAGRRGHFEPRVQDALVAHLVALAPDLVLITGDFTAQALDGEFAAARDALQPVLDTTPTFAIPGNHDAYTAEAARTQAIRRWFGPWMGLGDGPITRFDLGDVTCLGLDPNAPTWLFASAELPAEQLDGLAAALSDPDLASRHVVLCVHYPLLDRHGQVYDGLNHGLVNAGAVIEVLRAAPVKPRMILCGHEHHGYRVDLELGDASVPLFDCGSSGYAWMPDKRRAAAMNLYTLGDDGRVDVERFLFDGSGFAPEPGGAYATGR